MTTKNCKFMDTIYLDNAATTPILPEVIKTVSDVMGTIYGNPSSTHQIGRKAKGKSSQYS